MLNEDSSTPLLKFVMNTWLSISWLEFPNSCGTLVEIENTRDRGIRFKLLIRDRFSQIPRAEQRADLASYIKEKNTAEFSFNGTDATIWTSDYLGSPRCDSIDDLEKFFGEKVLPVLDRFTQLVMEHDKQPALRTQLRV